MLILCLVDVSCLLLSTDPSYTMSFATEIDVSCLLLNTDPSYTMSFPAEIYVSCLLLNTDPSYTMSFACLPTCCFTCNTDCVCLLACLLVASFIHTTILRFCGTFYVFVYVVMSPIYESFLLIAFH